MPLGDDQKAMLRLLAREQSYEDIAALMGLSVDEVVTRAKGAVEQLEAEGIPAPSLPEAPGGFVPAAPKPPEPKVEKAPEPKPEKAPEPSPVAPPPVAPTPPSSIPPAAKKPRQDKVPLIAIGVGAVGAIVIVVLAVLLISNSGGDDSSSASGSGDGTTVAENNGSGSASREPTTAQLEAVDGSDATGSAEFGRVKDSLALGVKADGVEKLPKGQIYMVWLADTPEKMLPLTALVANKAERINASYEVPTEAVIYLASGEFNRLVITKTVNSELQKSLEQANEDKKFPTYTGDPVLEGEIVGPIVGAAKRLEERQKERKEEAE